jgi:hypothetical protein
LPSGPVWPMAPGDMTVDAGGEFQIVDSAA